MRYKALTGLNFTRDDVSIRVEAGDVTDKLLDTSIPWLLEQGLIEPVEDAPKKAATKKKSAEVAAEEAIVEPTLVVEGE